MTDASLNTVPDPAAAALAGPPKKSGFTFTDDGCRTELRVGALIVMGAVFLWLWAGPRICSQLYVLGALLLLVGAPLQAIQGRAGRPGYPWKLALAFTALGALMWPDLRFRDAPGAPVQVQEVAPLLLAAGLWLLLWWPISRSSSKSRFEKSSTSSTTVTTPT